MCKDLAEFGRLQVTISGKVRAGLGLVAHGSTLQVEAIFTLSARGSFGVQNNSLRREAPRGLSGGVATSKPAYIMAFSWQLSSN